MNHKVVNPQDPFGVREGALKFLTECLRQPMGNWRMKFVYPMDVPDQWVKDAAYYRWRARGMPNDPSGMDQDYRLAKAELLNTALGMGIFHCVRVTVYVQLVFVAPHLSFDYQVEVYRALIREFWNMCGCVVHFLPFAENAILERVLKASGFRQSYDGWRKYKP